jgi:hypothetical protein
VLHDNRVSKQVLLREKGKDQTPGRAKPPFAASRRGRIIAPSNRSLHAQARKIGGRHRTMDRRAGLPSRRADANKKE